MDLFFQGIRFSKLSATLLPVLRAVNCPVPPPSAHATDAGTDCAKRKGCHRGWQASTDTANALDCIEGSDVHAELR